MSEEMNTLFRFWSYFLRDHYNSQMYADFKKYAEEDAAHNYYYGMDCLFRFYSYGLEKRFREKLYQEFEEITLKVPPSCWIAATRRRRRKPCEWGEGGGWLTSAACLCRGPQYYEQDANLYGLEKFWAFHHYKGFPKSCKLQMNEKVRRPAAVTEPMDSPRRRGV